MSDILVEKTITGSGQWSEAIRLKGNFLAEVRADAVSATFNLQRRRNAADTWQTVTKDDTGAAKAITGAGQFVGVEVTKEGAEYRIGCSAWTSGTNVVVSITQ